MLLKEQVKKRRSGFSFILDPLSLILCPRLRRSGQILIPSILIIPSLMLFIYLIFETTKISREKIRQQFAVDSAAFIQMGDYTNILNRTAYVNGAFPYRIFKEAYECTSGCSSGTEDHCLKLTDDSGTICTYKMLWEAGAIPKYKDDVENQPATPLDNKPKWEIAFKDPPRGNMNTNPAAPENDMTLTTSDQGMKIYIFWDPAIGIYKFYAQVYSLLGTVEESQMTVFERLTDNFSFFRKSYYLNANTKECVDSPNLCAEDGIRSHGGFREKKIVRNSGMFLHYIKRIIFHAKVPQSGLPPYFLGKTNPPQDLTTCPNCNPKGLFQLATFSAGALRDVGKGYNVYQGWDVPSNYFGVDFKSKVACRETGRACVHALVASQCPQLGSDNNCVWPNPTPKYQTRLYP